MAYELELPNVGEAENISLKMNSDSPILISSKDDVEDILGILEGTKPTTKRGEIGTPVRTDEIVRHYGQPLYLHYAYKRISEPSL